MNNSEKFASVFGLDIYEAKVYLALIRGGPSMISKIARDTTIPRMAIYRPIKSLLKRGFLSITVIGKRKHYQAISLKKLRYIVEQKKSEADRLIDEFMDSDQITVPQNGLAVQYFVGKQGITTAGQIFLKETKSKIWYSFENLVGITELVGLDFESNYIKERVTHGIKSKMIVSTDGISAWLREFLTKDKEQMRETIVLSPNQYHFDSTIVVTKGLSLLINVEMNPFALLIRNASLADTLINIHKLSWDRFSKEG